MVDARALIAAANEYANAAPKVEEPAETAAPSSPAIIDALQGAKTKPTLITDGSDDSDGSAALPRVRSKIRPVNIPAVGPRGAVTAGSPEEAALKRAVASGNKAQELVSKLSTSMTVTPSYPVAFSPSGNTGLVSNDKPELRPAHDAWNRAMALHDTLKAHLDQLPANLHKLHTNMNAVADSVESASQDLLPEHKAAVDKGVAELRRKADWVKDRITSGSAVSEWNKILNPLVNVKSNLMKLKTADGKFSTKINQARLHKTIRDQVDALQSAHKALSRNAMSTFVPVPVTQSDVQDFSDRIKGKSADESGEYEGDKTNPAELRVNQPILSTAQMPSDTHPDFSNVVDGKETNLKALSKPGHVWLTGTHQAGQRFSTQRAATEDNYNELVAELGPSHQATRRMKQMLDFAAGKSNVTFFHPLSGEKVKAKSWRAQIAKPATEQGAVYQPSTLSVDESGIPTINVPDRTKTGAYPKQSYKEVFDAVVARPTKEERLAALAKENEDIKKTGAVAGIPEVKFSDSDSESQDIPQGTMRLSDGTDATVSRFHLELLKGRFGEGHQDVKAMDALLRKEEGRPSAEEEAAAQARIEQNKAAFAERESLRTKNPYKFALKYGLTAQGTTKEETTSQEGLSKKVFGSEGGN